MRGAARFFLARSTSYFSAFTVTMRFGSGLGSSLGSVTFGAGNIL